MVYCVTVRERFRGGEVMAEQVREGSGSEVVGSEQETTVVSDEIQIETYEELRERRVRVDGHRSPCAMDW